MRQTGKYYEYWGFNKPPFDSVPDPEMYFDMHSSVENAVSETIFAIEEGNECLAVIVGDVGLGKTMALRVIVDSLDETRYRIAFLTNPDMTFIQIMKEIIGQLRGDQCMENRREALLEIFNRVLFETKAEGKKVLIFIDEANAMKSSNLESLRLLTNMQGDDENLMTIVLAGQLELARRLEHLKHRNLFQRIGVYCRLNKIESRDLMRDYVEHRLERAGTMKRIFTDAAYDAVYEYSERGVPRLINKLAKLSLKAGQTHSLASIDAPVIHQIAARFSRMSTALQKERADRLQDGTSPAEAHDLDGAVATKPPSSPVHRRIGRPLPPSETATEKSVNVHETENTSHSEDTNRADVGVDDIEQIRFPAYIYTEALHLPMDQRVRFAGQLAAQTLRKYPHLTQKIGKGNDPVPAWNALRNVILRQVEEHVERESVQVGLPV